MIEIINSIEFFIKRLDRKTTKDIMLGFCDIKFDNDPIKMDPNIARAEEYFAKRDVKIYQDLDIFIKFT